MPADSEERPQNVEEVLAEIYSNSLTQVIEAIENGIDSGASTEDIASDAMKAAGWAPTERIKFWDPMAVVGIKADLVIVLNGMQATVIRKNENDPATLEQPGHDVTIEWGDGGRQPKWIKRLDIKKITPPEGRKV